MSSSPSLRKIVAITLVFSFLLLENCSQRSSTKPEEAKPNDTPLGELMGHMQYDFIKLGLALQHGNRRLANFYMHEVNEVYGDIVAKKIMDGQIDISQKISQILPTKSRLEEVIETNDTANFLSAYHSMVVSCNNCHMETNHAFIIIEEPQENFNGQNFGVQHPLYSE